MSVQAAHRVTRPRKLADLTTGKTGDLIQVLPERARFALDPRDDGRFTGWFAAATPRSKSPMRITSGPAARWSVGGGEALPRFVRQLIDPKAGTERGHVEEAVLSRDARSAHYRPAELGAGDESGHPGGAVNSSSSQPVRTSFGQLRCSRPNQPRRPIPSSSSWSMTTTQPITTLDSSVLISEWPYDHALLCGSPHPMREKPDSLPPCGHFRAVPLS